MFRALLLFLALLTLPAATVVVEHARGPSYTGPLDIVSGATAFYALRAGSAAIAAAGTQKLVNIRRASDNVDCDFLVASSGGFGVTTATCNSSTQGGLSYSAFMPSDGTASCTLAGTAAACTGATGTVHINDVVTGTGLTQPCIVASASNTAPTIEIAGTTTSCGSVGVAETFTFQVAGFITELYDQSGNSANVTQATAANQAQFLPDGGNGLPAAYGNGSTDNYAQTIAASSQPFTIVAVAERTANFTSNSTILGLGNGSFFSTNANKVGTFFGSATSVTANDSALHSLIFATSGSSSVTYVDGTSNSVNPGTGVLTANWQLFSQNSGVNRLTGYINEAGLWPSLFNSTQAGNMRTNQKNYWSTP
jgi:hypothetical protein